MWTRDSGPVQHRRASDGPVVRAPVITRDAAIEQALARNAIDVVFQPIFDLASGLIAGAEALARVEGISGAEELFARAAGAGLAERLSRQVQRNVLQIAAQWSGALAGLPLSINLLPEDIARDGYDDWLLAEIAAAGIAPERLTVEITEQALIADAVAVGARLARLRAAGLKVALDDFGTGYASMAHLARLPLDYLKIDRSLIARIESGEKDRIVVRNILRLARELELEAVIEGVETAGQLALLSDWGCGLFQGFLRARPMHLTQLAAFAATHR